MITRNDINGETSINEETYLPTWFTGNCLQGSEIDKIFDSFKQKYGNSNVYRTINVASSYSNDTLLGTYQMCRWYGRDTVRFYRIAGTPPEPPVPGGFSFPIVWILIIVVGGFIIWKMFRKRK